MGLTLHFGKHLPIKVYFTFATNSTASKTKKKQKKTLTTEMVLCSDGHKSGPPIHNEPLRSNHWLNRRRWLSHWTALGHLITPHQLNDSSQSTHTLGYCTNTNTCICIMEAPLLLTHTHTHTHAQRLLNDLHSRCHYQSIKHTVSLPPATTPRDSWSCTDEPRRPVHAVVSRARTHTSVKCWPQIRAAENLKQSFKEEMQQHMVLLSDVGTVSTKKQNTDVFTNVQDEPNLFIILC